MLTKRPEQQYVPGRAAVPARPAQTICTPAPSTPASGTWLVKCEVASVFIGWDNGPATFDNPGPFPKPVFLTGQPVCRSVWLPNPVSPQPAPQPVCVTYPAVEAVAGIPGRIDVVPVRAWDAGANSEQVLDGDVRVAFTIGQVLGAVIGFTQDRESAGSADRMSHAFAFTTDAAARPVAQVREGARVVTAAVPYDIESTEFEIRRTGGTVRYLRDGVVIYTSRAKSAGELSVACAVYGSGDVLP